MALGGPSGPLPEMPALQPSLSLLALAAPAPHGAHCVASLSCDCLSPARSGHQGDSDGSALFFERPAPGPALEPATQRHSMSAWGRMPRELSVKKTQALGPRRAQFCRSRKPGRCRLCPLCHVFRPPNKRSDRRGAHGPQGSSLSRSPGGRRAESECLQGGSLSPAVSLPGLPRSLLCVSVS